MNTRPCKSARSYDGEPTLVFVVGHPASMSVSVPACIGARDPELRSLRLFLRPCCILGAVPNLHIHIKCIYIYMYIYDRERC